MDDLIADADKQSAGRYRALIRNPDGTDHWKGERIWPTRRAAIIEALDRLKET